MPADDPATEVESAPVTGPRLTRRTVLAASAAASFVAVAGSGAAVLELPSDRSGEAPSVRVDYVCGTCGGNAVSRDGWAAWDVGTQDWVLGTAFDYAYCHDCDGEARLEEVQLGAPGSSATAWAAAARDLGSRPSAIGMSRSRSDARS